MGSENTCTKESPLKTHSSSSCSKSDTVVQAHSTAHEPVMNNIHLLYHQSNLSQLDSPATASFNTEHEQHFENDLQGVNKHIFEIQLDTENPDESPDEIPSSPNVPDAHLPEIPIPNETSNTGSQDINELQNLVAKEFPQLSDSDNENEEIPLNYFQIEEDQQPPQFRPASTCELNITSAFVQYSRDQILQPDEDIGWKVSVPDDMPLQGLFTVNPGQKVEMTTKNPEDFFYLNFDDHMFETIADQTNDYARK